MGHGEDLPPTLEFARTLVRAENLVAVFCGHIHFAHADSINLNAIQYVGAPGFDANSRLVEVPATVGNADLRSRRVSRQGNIHLGLKPATPFVKINLFKSHISYQKG